MRTSSISEPTPEQVKKDYALLDEFVRQIATQAALLAGFTFTILTATSLESPLNRRGIAFVVCTASTIVLELFAAFILSTLAVVVKINLSPQMDETFQLEQNLAWISYLLGLLTFLASLILLIWIKYPTVALWITSAIIIVFAFGAVVLGNMVRKQNSLIIN